jgi:purine-cytosine permease-like protein
VDAAVALTISWVPLGADYSRHSRSARSAFAGGFAGYGVTQIACLLMGVVALSEVGRDPNRIFDLFLSLPLGVVAFAVLVLRETDQSFANVYSTAVSIQNMAPRWDRRVLTTGIGALAIAVALTVDIGQYTNFLYLIGGVFIPLSGALIGCWLRLRGGVWNTSAQAPLQPAMLIAWVVGFVVYQLVNPGAIPLWSDFWTTVGTRLHTLGHPWLSASVVSFAVALVLALAFGRSGQAPAGSERSGSTAAA